MPNSTERLSLILDARVADFEQGLERAENSLGRLATQAQKSGGDFQKSVDDSINAAQKSLNNLGRTKSAEDLRDLFSRAKQAAASFQKDFERIQRDLVRTQEQANKALVKSQQDLAVAQGQSQRDIVKAREDGAKRQQQILNEETAAEKKAKQAQLDAVNQFNAAQKAAAQQRLQTLDSLSKQEAAFRTRGIRPNRRERAVLDAQKRDQEERQQILRRERELIERRRGIQAAAADPGADRVARRGLVKAEREITALIEQERERRISITQRIDAREIQIRENVAAKAAAVEKRIGGRNFELARAQADADEKIRISQAAAARDAAIKKAGDTLAQESANKRKKIAQDEARTEEDIQKRLERLEARKRQIIKANIGALDAAKGAEDKYQGELTETANKIRELTAALEALRQRRADAARAGLDRIGAPPPGGGAGGRAGGRGGAGGGLGGGPSPASAAGALRDLNSSVNRLRIGILNIQTALGLVGASFGIKESLDLASQFERELASINTLLVNAQVPIERYRDQLVQLSVESSKDLIDLTQGLYQTVSAGIPAIEGAAGAFELLVQAQKAAVAGNATTRQSVNALITTVKAYEATGITAAEASDKLFTTVRLGRTTFEELSSTIGRILGITANFGLSLDESLAAVATITRVIPSTAESITQLRALIRGIVRPAKQVSNLLADINERTGAQLEFSAKALREQGLSGIIEQILEVTGGDPDILARLFPNVRALGGAAVLTASTFRDFIDAIDQMGNSADASSVALKKVENTLQEQSRILRSRFQKVLIEIGEKSFPLIKDALVDIGNFLEDNQGTFEAFFSGILVSARDLFTFLKENFDSIVRAVEAFLLVRFPAAFAAFKGLIAPEGEGFGAIGNALLLGLAGSTLFNAIGNAAAKLGAAFVAKFTPVVATGVRGAIASGAAAAAGGLVTTLLTAVGAAAVVGIGLLVNRSLEAAEARLQAVAEGRLNEFVGSSVFLSQSDRERAATAGKEKQRVETLAAAYESASKAAQRAGLAVADFYETLDKNRGDLEKTVTEINKSLEGIATLGLTGDLIEIESGSIDRVLRSVSVEAKQAQGAVTELQAALVELRTGAGLGERGKAIFDQARSELGAAANRPAFTGPGGTSVQVEDTAAIQRRAVEIAQAELEERRKALADFNQEDLKRQVAQQEQLVNATEIRIRKLRKDLAETANEGVRDALTRQIEDLSTKLETELRPVLENLQSGVVENIKLNDIIDRPAFEAGIIDAVQRAAKAGELSLARVVRDAPKLTAASTFGQVLEDQAAAQLQTIEFLAGSVEKIQERIAVNQKKLEEEGLTDRQVNEYQENIRKANEDLQAALSLQKQLQEGTALPVEQIKEQFGALLPTIEENETAARLVAEQISQAFEEGRYEDALFAFRTINGEVTDVAGALRLWALRQREVIQQGEQYRGIAQELKEVTTKEAETAKRLIDLRDAEAQAKEEGASISIGSLRTQIGLTEVLLKTQTEQVKTLQAEADRTLGVYSNIEALIQRIMQILIRNQPSLALVKAQGRAFDAARAIAKFDREQEIIRRIRQRKDLEFEAERLDLESSREEILERIRKIERSISLDFFKGVEERAKQLQALRSAAIESEEGLRGLAQAVSELDVALLDVESKRAEEDADLAIKRLRKQQEEIFAREAVRKANAMGRKRGAEAGAGFVAAASEEIAANPPDNLIPTAFINELKRLDQEILLARADRDRERLRGLAREYQQTLIELNDELNKIVQDADTRTIELFTESVELVGDAFVQAAENTLEAVKQTLSGLEQVAQGYRDLQTLADSEDPLLRSLLPASAVDRSQRLLELRRAELSVLEAQKRAAQEEAAVQQANISKALSALEIDRRRLDLEEERLRTNRGASRPLEQINQERDLLQRREQQSILEQQRSSQQLLAEQRKLDLARQRLIIETSILPTAAISRAADKLAGSFFERLQQLLPSLFVTGANVLFNKINEGIVELESFLGFKLPDFLDTPQGTKVLVSDRFGTTLKDIVDAIRAGRPGPNITGGSAGSAGSTAARRTPRSTRVLGSAGLFEQDAPASAAKQEPAKKKETSGFLGAFSAIQSKVLRLGNFLQKDLPKGIADFADGEVPVIDREGNSFSEVIQAILDAQLPPGTNVPGGPVDPDPNANVPGGPVDPDPNVNVPGPEFRPVIASYIGPVLTAYTQAIELVTDQLIRGAEIFASKVVEPLLNVSLVGIDKLLDGLSDALGVLTDLSQEFTGQVIRRPPQGSDVVAIRREAAAQRFAEQRARAAGLVQRTTGEGSATGRAVRALEKAAKDALKLTERIIEGLPAVIDKFLDLLIERGPELLEKAGDALVIVVRKLLQRLPEIVRALLPVLADIVINLVEEIINQLPQIIEAFAASLNILLIKSGELFGRVIASLARNFDEIIKSIVRAFPQILSGLIVGVAAGVAEAVIGLLKGLIPGVGGSGSAGKLLGALAGGFLAYKSSGTIAALVGGTSLGLGPLIALTGAGALLGSALGSLFHDGGEVKAGQRNRDGARAMLAAGAGRYRTGGVVLPSVSDYLSQQLRGDEVPAVLQVGERVLSRRQVGALGGQSGIDDLLANRGQQDMSVESNVVLSYDKSNDPLTDALMNALLPRLQVRGTTNVNQNPRTVGTRPARGRGV